MCYPLFSVGLEPAGDQTPEEAFHYAWACELLDSAIAKVQETCRSAGQEVSWQVFSARLLQPILERSKAPSLGQVCRMFGIASEVQASNMMITVKRKFRAVLRERVRASLASARDVDAETEDLTAILSGRAGN